MRAGGAKLSDCVCQRADGCNVKDRVRVLAVVQASLGKDDRDEVDARVAEKRDRGAIREELHKITSTNVTLRYTEEGNFGLPLRPRG